MGQKAWPLQNVSSLCTEPYSHYSYRVCSSDFSCGGHKWENQPLSVCLFVCLSAVFSHTVAIKVTITLPVIFLLGQGPGDGHWWALLTELGSTGIAVQCCPRKQRWEHWAMKKEQRMSAVQKAPPDSGAIVVVGGGPPFSYNPHQPFQSSVGTVEIFLSYVSIPLATETSHLFN